MNSFPQDLVATILESEKQATLHKKFVYRDIIFRMLKSGGTFPIDLTYNEIIHHNNSSTSNPVDWKLFREVLDELDEVGVAVERLGPSGYIGSNVSWRCTLKPNKE